MSDPHRYRRATALLVVLLTASSLAALAPSGLSLGAGAGVSKTQELDAKAQPSWRLTVSLRPEIISERAGFSLQAGVGGVGQSSADGGYLYNGFFLPYAALGLWLATGTSERSFHPLLQLSATAGIGQYRNTNNSFLMPGGAITAIFPFAPFPGLFRWWIETRLSYARRDPEIEMVGVSVSLGAGVSTIGRSAARGE